MEGMVIQTISYKEQSKLVYLYTPEGMKSILVRHLKENIGFTTTFNIVTFVTTNGKLPTLMSYDVIKSFYDFYEQLDKVPILMNMLQVLKALDQEAPHQRIYPFFKKCMELLYIGQKPQYPLALFLTKMLAVFGVRPALSSCVLCGRLDIVGFSVTAGGAICSSCGGIADGILEAFQLLYTDQKYDENAYDLDYKIVLKVLKEYYSSHVYLKLKNA